MKQSSSPPCTPNNQNNNNKRNARHFTFHLEQQQPAVGRNNETTTVAATKLSPTWRTFRSGGGSVGGGGGSAASSSVILASPLRVYFSRRPRPSKHNHQSLLLNPGVNEKFVGIYSPVALVWGIVFLVVPAAYLYIALVLLRELCRTVPPAMTMLQHYLPWLARTVTALHSVSRWVEIWCAIEAVFYLCLKWHIHWLQTRVDPLEASLSAAPLMELTDRQWLWQRMMLCEAEDPIDFLRGWFFDQPLASISKYDVRDFIAWSMFEGRHQEHLTDAELRQLEQFVREMEWRISLHLYGEQQENDNDDDEDDDELDRDPVDAAVPLNLSALNGRARGRKFGKDDEDDDDNDDDGDDDDAYQIIFTKLPKKQFVFAEQSTHEESNYFSDMYESLRRKYERAYEENMTAVRHATADFHPVQDLRNMVHGATADSVVQKRISNLMAETGKTIEKAEVSAMKGATRVYESLVPAGSQMEKQLSAVTHATSQQMAEAWNSVKNLRESLETARFLKKQRQRIRQQLKGYRELLKQMRRMSTDIPSKQMASMMRRITECNERMELLEQRARSSFVQATGLALKNIPFLPRPQEPVRFAKYSSDPLLGIAVYPLGFHLLVFGLSDVPLRILLHRRGFERRVMGSVAYYYHPGAHSADEDSDVDVDTEHEDDDDDGGNTPIVFVHGIGVGLLPYLAMIDALVKTGRPVLLPEIPYITGFRPFQSPCAVLPPAVVCSTMTAMLASHGFLKATWMGHSYGTSWLSYMCKFAPKTVAALLFLDPICFCLHVPYLTKQFVYLRPDPGTVSYMVRTDVIINWTIQRSFPWAWVALFTEQIKVPCAVILSENDALVPASKVENYLKSKDVHFRDFDLCTEDFFFSGGLVEKEPTAKAATVVAASVSDNGNVAQDASHHSDGDSTLATEHETKNNDDDMSAVVPMAAAKVSRRHPHITCAVLRGDGHGDWLDHPSETVPTIVAAAEALCRRAELVRES